MERKHKQKVSNETQKTLSISFCVVTTDSSGFKIFHIWRHHFTSFDTIYATRTKKSRKYEIFQIINYIFSQKHTHKQQKLKQVILIFFSCWFQFIIEWNEEEATIFIWYLLLWFVFTLVLCENGPYLCVLHTGSSNKKGKTRQNNKYIIFIINNVKKYELKWVLEDRRDRRGESESD